MAIISVTNLNDSGDGSLRDAIDIANTTVGEDTIEFINALSGGTIELTSGELLISDSLGINGLGADLLTVDAGNLGFRVFHINDGDFGDPGNFLDVSIDGLTITGGNPTDDGGSILNRENLTITNSTISGNEASSGGGIYNNGTLTVTDSTISGNETTRGGGIYNKGILTVTNSTISGNEAAGGGGIQNNGNLTIANSTISGNEAALGGGIQSNGDLTITTITNSTISGNEAAGGGGIYNNGILTVTNSTISGNEAALGGGIQSNGDLTITNSTISGNIYGGIQNDGTLTVTNSTISGNTGEGIRIINPYPTTTSITNSTISGNTGDGISASPTYEGSIFNITNSIIANSGGIDCSLENTNTTNIHSLIEDGSCDPLLQGDPSLGPLQDNGGPTQTQALLPNSIAIDMGSNAGAVGPNGILTFDQRGPGFDRIVNNTVDIGAYEVQPVPEPSSLIGLVAFGVGILTISKRKLAKIEKKNREKRS